MSLYFTSDPHFCYPLIIKKDNRPFRNIDQMNDYIINQWNIQAKEEDTIYIIGDFLNMNAYDTKSWKKAIKIPKKITAKKILILGNNEIRIINYYFDGCFDAFKKMCIEYGFENVYEDLVLELDEFDKPLYLNHFPSKHRDGYFNLFGHVHRYGGLWRPYGLNVGCDLNYFKLFSIEDIQRYIEIKRNNLDYDEDIID